MVAFRRLLALSRPAISDPSGDSDDGSVSVALRLGTGEIEGTSKTGNDRIVMVSLYTPATLQQCV